ncbi:beta strand repeat-containing protein [Paracholeplasma manati]|uniref:beta strand repeat-containing protein n=1 Tax=Paracholeplasma manati TaxID=591373 RepID=UPI002407D392|nr:hypothetical protein [Paracholeplasma manati]MDG0887796.1 hypothetical protein [Paracholeplasma manati]
MSFTAAEMLQYLNYAALGVIGLAMFWGFIQGFYKSTFFLIWTVGILVVGFFTIPMLAGMVMKVDLSAYLASVPIPIEGLVITNIQDTAINYLIDMQSNLANVLVEGSDALALVVGVIQMAVSLVLFILLFILNATVFKFVGWIIWMIIKPKKRDSNGRKKRKTFVSRLGGAGIGALRGAFSVLLISLPFAALVSLSSGLDLATTVSSEPQYQLMLVNDELVLVEVQQPMMETSELLDEVKAFLSEYRTTYVGMIAGYVKIDEVALDEYVFDEVFSVRVQSDNLDTQIKFRAEMEKALDAVALLVEANGGSTTFGDDFIYNLDPETAGEVFELITNLDIIEVVIPVGLEYLVNSGDFNEMLEGYEDLFELDDLKAIDYMRDLGLLGDVFVNALSLVQEQAVPIDELNYFLFDGETVVSIFDALGELDLIEYGLPIGLNFLIQSEAVQQTFTDLGITSDDITLPTGEELQADFANIANIYLAVQAMGFTSMDDFNNLTDPAVLNAVPDQAIADLFDAIFAFSIIENNSSVASEYIFNFISESLPPEFQGLITLADISDNFNANEITNLILLAKVVVSTGILDLVNDTENPDYSVILSDENIAAIVAKISETNLITSKMNDVIAQLLAGLDLGVTLEIPSTIDWAAESGQTELTALLKGAREILASDIISGDLSALNDTMADNLSSYISDSIVIRYNLNAIFEMALSSQEGLSDYEIALPETWEDWTEVEINSLLKAAIILSSAGSDPNALLALTEAQINTIAKSKVIANTFRNVFLTMVDTGGDLEGMLFVPEGLTWFSTENTTGELEYLLLALQSIIPGGDINNINVDLNTLMTADVDALLRSKVIEMTLVETIVPMIETGDLSAYISTTLPNGDDYVWYQGVDETYPDGDLKPLLEAIQGLSDLGISFDALDYDAITTALADEQAIQDLNDLLLSSRVLHSSLDKLFTEVLTTSGLDVTLDNSDDPTFWQGTESEDGELIKLLRAVQLIGTDELDPNTISSQFLTDLLDTESTIVRVLISNVLKDTITNIPAGALDAEGNITQVELRAIATALSQFGSVNEISTIDPATVDASMLTSLLDANSLIVNRQISDAIKGAVTNIPAAALDAEGDITSTELRAIADALSQFNSIDEISNIDATSVNATMLSNLLNAGSLIINRQISDAIKGAITDIPAAALDAEGDIKGTELDAIVVALANFGSVNELSNIDANTIDGDLLNDLLDANSLIVNRQISIAIKGAITDIPTGALDADNHVTTTELRAIAAALSNFNSVNELSSISANDITSALLNDLLDAESLIVNRQISVAVKAAITDIPAGALDADNHITTTELRAIATALSNFTSVNDMSSIDANSINSTFLNNLLDAESLIVNRQISIAVKGAIIDIPAGALDADNHITVTELRAIATALSNFTSVNDMSNIDANSITSTFLTDLLDAESLIVNRQISIAIKGAITDIPATALDTDNHITETELRAIATALSNFTSVNDMASISANDINATFLTNLLDAESIIVNRQISAAVIGSGLDIPAAAYASVDDITETELRALAAALVHVGSVDQVSNINASSINSTFLTNLLDAESLIVNRQISAAVIGSGLDIPAAAYASVDDITETELRALAAALVHVGSVDQVSNIDANSINSTYLTNLLDAESLIVNRQISSAIINSTIEVPSGALETANDIYETELRALAAALVHIGSVSDVSNIDANDIDSTLLNNLLAANSLIVNRQISSAIIGSGLAIPSDAYETVDDITLTELNALADALQYISGGVAGIANLTASTITGSLITNLLNANSVIVNRQISSAIITAGLTTGNTDAIDNSVGPRNGEVKNIEMVGLAEALTAMGPTTTVADLSSLSPATVAALDDATIDIMFGANYTIIYYKLEAEMRNNALYLLTLDNSDYEGGNPANRILRTTLAADLKSGVYA